MSIIKIGIIGDYEAERLSHKATIEALKHCADSLEFNLEIQWLNTEALERDTYDLSQFAGLWCAPGVYKSMKGALKAIQFARENDYPFIGTCAGFQHIVIEYARNELGLKDVQHAEYDANASDLIITPLACSLVGETRKVYMSKNSTVYKYYNQTEVEERFSCTFGLNPEYRKLMEESGFKVVGTDEKDEVRILELPRNRFFIATLFQPQLSSLPTNPHKLIVSFLTMAKEFQLLRG